MTKKRILKEGATVAIAALILAIAFNTTLLPLEIVIGGSSGLSILANHFFGISPAIVILICYMGALVVGFFLLGKKKIKKSVFGTFIYPFWIFVTSPLSDYVKSLSLDMSEYLIVVIIGAIISGVAFGLVYKIGYTTGGSDIASQIVNKYLGVTIGSANMMVNTVIVISGGFIFGWTQVMYAILILYVIGIVTDKILLGVSFSKAFYIITDKGEEVKKYIADEFNQNFTELEAMGGYTSHGNRVLMCVVPTRDYFKLKEGINVIDEGAFFLIMDAYELENRI